jgi:serine/threonine protein kinase
MYVLACADHFCQFQNLRGKYPCATTDCLDLLLSFLKFDPTSRVTADDAMGHPYFDRIKRQGYLQTKSEMDSNDSTESNSTDDSSESSSYLCLHPFDSNEERSRELHANLDRNVSFACVYWYYSVADLLLCSEVCGRTSSSGISVLSIA